MSFYYAFIIPEKYLMKPENFKKILQNYMQK